MRKKQYDYVYFIEDYYGNVKIGRTLNVQRRLQEIQLFNSMPIKCIAQIRCIRGIISNDGFTANGVECYLHRYFKDIKIRGEWFDGDGVKSWITKYIPNGSIDAVDLLPEDTQLWAWA